MATGSAYGVSEGQHVHAYLNWTSTHISGNKYKITCSLTVNVNTSIVSNLWYSINIRGSSTSGNSPSGSFGTKYHSAEVTANSDGTLSGHISAGVGGNGYEAWPTAINPKIGPANYSVTYDYCDGNGGSAYYDGYDSTSHTVISTIPTHKNHSDVTTNYTIIGDANEAKAYGVSNTSIKASKRVYNLYTFKGWSTTKGASSASYTSGSTITVNKDITLYGVWSNSSGTTYSNCSIGDMPSLSWPTESTGYTITLNAGSGASVSPTTLSSGIVTTHTFKGWHVSSTASSPAGNDIELWEAGTFYAVWDTKTTDNSTVTLPTPTKSNITTYHNVTLDGNGGTTSTKSISCPIITSYSFKGWSTSSSASSGTTGSYTPTSDITLYATWSANSPTYTSVTLPTTGLSRSSSSSTYTTTLNLNGGSHSKTSVRTGTTTSYSFSHWSSTSTGSSVGASISGTTYSKLYARWSSSTSSVTANLGTPSKSISNKVTFDPSGGTVSPTSKNVTGSYSFLGWYTSNSSSGTKVSNTSSYRASSNNTLYAIWGNSSLSGIQLPTPSRSDADGTFTVTLNANGGSLSSSISNPITITSKTSFIFAGWSTVSGDRSNIVTNTSNYTTGSDCTLYAIWDLDTDTDGISLPTSGVTRGNSVVESYTIKLDPIDGSVDPTYKNTNKIRKYVFKGWSTTGSTSNMVSNTNYVPISDITLKAAYNTSDSINPVDLPDAVKVDHSFLGWSTVEDSNNYVAKRYTPSNNITLYANYLANYRASLWIWYNGKWNKCIVNLFTGDRFTGAV